MSKKKIIVIIAIVIILLAIALIAYFINKNKSDEEIQYFEMMNNGTKVNISEKLLETKKIDGLEITNIELTELGNITQLKGTITNTSNKEKEESVINAVLLNQKGNEMATMGIYVKALKPGESTELNASATLNYVNAYNIKFVKSKK